MKEIKSLTGIRGVAAIYVMVYHFFGTDNSSVNRIFHSTLLLKHGYLSVDLFFILSGFLMCVTSENMFSKGLSFYKYFHFIKKRFSRIYPIYFVAISIAFLFFHYNNPLSYIIALILMNVVFYKQISVLEPIWSLSAEWITYTIFPFIIYFTSKFNRRTIIYIYPFISFLLLLFISFKLYKLGYFRVLNVVSLNGLTRCIAEYLLGISVFYSSQKQISIKIINLIQGVAALMIILLLFVCYADILIVFAMALLIFGLSYNVGYLHDLLSEKIPYFLGLISYSIYLIHTFFHFTPYYHYSNTDSEYYISRFIAIILTIIISYLTYKYIEIPSIKYFTRKLNVSKLNK
ncbi:acyltransferase family protein [Spirosoma sp. HMF3257]|uniref:Acyltransferase 3 domain-containing protein n=1 Tax=Spirosoma telluris TaxID=2183553 RepID=A0A327NH60_9BACT|nr:acyltransferase family protein [Spirosoma telluris]RAI74721.1 hypothetical protein HMF3257_11440 [Spirosoma telluris]